MLRNVSRVLLQTVDSFYDAALALAFPQECAVCLTSIVERRADAPGCANCWDLTAVYHDDQARCWKCGAPATKRPIAVATREEDVRCRRCADRAFDAARAVGPYAGALRAAVLALKREPHLSPRVANLLRRVARSARPLGDATLLVPVPLHDRRRRERGFNQAEIIARALARAGSLSFDVDSLARTVHSEKHRAGMDAASRRASVEDAFAVTRPRLIAGRRVLLIDDVMTTGATASACAAALKKAGAAEVYVLTIAHAFKMAV